MNVYDARSGAPVLVNPYQKKIRAVVRKRKRNRIGLLLSLVVLALSSALLAREIRRDDAPAQDVDVNTNYSPLAIDSAADVFAGESLPSDRSAQMYDWFDERQEQIYDSADGDLKATSEPIPEIWKVKSPVVSLYVRNVRWEKKEEVKRNKSPESRNSESLRFSLTPVRDTTGDGTEDVPPLPD